ncbi:MAG TPA: protein kinase [Gemmatimonadales bacterium]|jgi:serine/threonine-protein kinase|nr:protein kinase [Gemmatimonadales bacterium]
MADLREQLQSGLADRYRIERELGRGGMATVYLAQDLRHKRPVALKVLHPELALTLGPERFQREIETVARLQHPHILTVHDSGESAGQVWYTMPYVEGESLRDRLRRERQLPLADALQITLEVADALGYAHRHGIVHRDIKPENILLTEGHALVADFGVARALVSAGGAQLTETGSAVGTPAYMSPEQSMADRSLDGRSDLYSVGCVLYEMLTGEAPYTGPSAQAVIAKRLMDPVPSARRLRETVPAGVDEALQRVLAKAPADRFVTAAEFARALQAGVASPAAIPTVPPASVAWAGRRRSVAPDGTYRRRMPVVAAALGLGFVIGLGVLFAWRRSHPRPEETGDAKVLAVLPFENLGDSSQAYFADGVGDEVRGKLSQLGGVAVIARTSSNGYRHTSKPPQQIAHELGAEYLLTATVRWEKHPDGTSQVRVSPELVRVTPGAAPTTRWQQGFDAALTDVFQVQAEIAGQVAQALNVALGDSAKHQLATRPTQSLPAYDAFLRGEAATQGMTTLDPKSLRQAIAAYEQALALDSTFVEAWAQLSRAEAYLYSSLSAIPATGDAARRAAERALTLAPTRSEGHQALGAYYGYVVADKPRAYAEDSTALALAPGNADILWAVGFDEHALQRWEAARSHLEQAVRLNPRSSITVHQLGLLLVCLRQYPEAERVLDHTLQLLPADLIVREDRAIAALAQGDLAQAQAIINAAPKEVDPTALVASVASYLDLVWVLDEAQQRLLLRLRPSAFDDNRASWGIMLAQTYAVQDDTAKERVYADSARLAYEQQLDDSSQGSSTTTSTFDTQRLAFLGLALAYLGNKAAAIREGQRGVALSPISRDAFVGPYIQLQLARIYILVGEPEKALDQLEPLLKIPYYLSPGWLRIDPNFAPLRGSPRFERLVKGP